MQFNCFLLVGFLFVGCGVAQNRSLRQIPSRLDNFASVEDYQIGPEWGKIKVGADNLPVLPTHLQRATKATASKIREVTKGVLE